MATSIGGDEFVVLSTSKEEGILEKTALQIKENIKKTPYTVAIGYAERKDKDIDIHKMTLLADEMMYKDKAEYYKTAGIDRRRR